MTSKRDIETRLDELEEGTESPEGFEPTDEQTERVNEFIDRAIEDLNEQGLERLDELTEELQEIDDLTADDEDQLVGEYWDTLCNPRYSEGDVYSSEPRSP